jgi:hypothetical protein
MPATPQAQELITSLNSDETLNPRVVVDEVQGTQVSIIGWTTYGARSEAGDTPMPDVELSSARERYAEWLYGYHDRATEAAKRLMVEYAEGRTDVGPDGIKGARALLEALDATTVRYEVRYNPQTTENRRITDGPDVVVGISCRGERSHRLTDRMRADVTDTLVLSGDQRAKDLAGRLETRWNVDYKGLEEFNS